MDPRIQLQDLARALPGSARFSGDAAVTGVAYDSRHVQPGDLFVALKGQKQDGHDRVTEAVRRGAVAVLAERSLETSVPVAVVPSTLEALSAVAAHFYGNPSQGMTLVGVTGTNGKTTVTYMLESIFRAAGKKTGVIGTVNYRWLEKSEPAPNTTPLSLDLQKLLARMKQDGVTHVAMEVSSHALALHRVDHVAFSRAVFTNLTRDHLDFHKDMQDYFEAKARLFDLLAEPEPKNKCAIINRDDPWSDKLLARVKTPVLTFALKATSSVGAADISLGPDGTSFLLTAPQGNRLFRLQTVGLHNVSNALAATGAALSLDVPMDRVQAGLESMAGVPGRLERVNGRAPAPFSVFVDYAHTDDALRNVLTTLQPLTRGRLITVFGCGGDRDRTKRPLMGEVAATLSDRVIVTSDNPRTEDPKKILLDIEVGLRRAGSTSYEIVPERAAAIDRALRSAREGDVVLIAGKGHETTQIFHDRTIHFDDRETARAVLDALS
jgi:UDP-N-acetylmuramoyl-L-alanyl-D-glutamate--2,6-diaminopimelate ligase